MFLELFFVILFVRMWVEMIIQIWQRQTFTSHPLREDVSWNIFYEVRYSSHVRHPLREDVSWNKSAYNDLKVFGGHPLREDVSWNIVLSNHSHILLGSSSSWGCELKWYCFGKEANYIMSSSSWGCELKFVIYPFSVWNNPVILFVRMWVEII